MNGVQVLTDPCDTVFLAFSPVPSIQAVRKTELYCPMSSVLFPLCCHLSNSYQFPKVKLKPLTVVVLSCSPTAGTFAISMNI